MVLVTGRVIRCKKVLLYSYMCGLIVTFVAVRLYDIIFVAVRLCDLSKINKSGF